MSARAGSGTRRRALLAGGPALLIVLLSVAGPWLAPYDVREPVTIPYGPPDGIAPLGGDALGRDVLSQLLAGGWGLLAMAAVIAVVVTGLGALLGSIAALRPRVGTLVERTADTLILLPSVLAIMLVILSWPGSGVLGLILLTIVLATPYAARVMTAAASGVASSGYVEAAGANGERLLQLVCREVLPNLRLTAATLLGLRFVAAVYLVSTAAFLQLPTSLGSANWALMIRENAPGILLNPWAVIAPSLALALLAISVNLAAEAVAAHSPAAHSPAPGKLNEGRAA